jgi:hypothetical protein
MFPKKCIEMVLLEEFFKYNPALITGTLTKKVIWNWLAHLFRISPNKYTFATTLRWNDKRDHFINLFKSVQLVMMFFPDFAGYYSWSNYFRGLPLLARADYYSSEPVLAGCTRPIKMFQYGGGRSPCNDIRLFMRMLSREIP